MIVEEVPIDEMSICRIIVKMSIDKMNRQNVCWRKDCIQDDFLKNDEIKWLVVVTVDKITFGKIMSIGNRFNDCRLNIMVPFKQMFGCFLFR